ncbi:MAG: FixH family protein [Reyranella sp.]|uniref:FixH family protein n=1 Tax=Reyranella sp. TaxID=1929291 RepID=UPI00272F34E4|nr:FixH family protein [Reyranella sp.]MDP1963906.1 FixH family protein [Reyranella sp.]MDP2374257.1 FixH family protein [Reyranella sp.]
MTTALASRSRYIPWLFVAGFAIVVGVNATMISFAVGSFSGLYTPKPRERGLYYNTVVAEQKARDTLGWRIDAAWRAETGRLEIAVSDANGQPLADARVFAELVRPVEKRPPVGMTLAATAAGKFAGYVQLPVRGNWDLDVVVERGGDRFSQTRRMFLR